MSIQAIQTPTAPEVGIPTPSRVATWGLIGAQLGVAAILGMGAFAKFFNFTDQGSKALADALSVGRGVITTIGLVEATVVILILIPRTRAIGALVAVATMIGALGAHATRIGFAGSATAEMWPLALVTLALASVVLIVRRRDLPVIGDSL